MRKAGILFTLILVFSIAPLLAQSTNQDFPTPVLTNEISGTIPARDIGDARLTRHFYTFYADNGDLFLNIETANLNGDIDIFEANTLRPLSKISLYYSDASTKTSRIIYFRQRLQVVLRVEGRSPNDDPARYRINFSGSFAAATDLPQPPDDLEPTISSTTSSEAVARTNSVGTIIEVLPPKKPVEISPEPSEIAETKTEPPSSVKPVPTRRTPSTRRPVKRPARETPPKVEEEIAVENKTEPKAPPRRPTRTSRPTVPRRTVAKKPVPVAEPKPDPLASVRLVVLLKDGYKIERPMNEVLRVNVDKGQLTIITKDGKIERFSILDVERMTIEQ
jgi:hypothetical protein